jgi:hypothetical protein
VPELGTLGSVRGALSNERPYRDLRNVDANYRFERSHRFAGSSRILALELLEMNSSRNVHPQSDDDEKQG